VADLPNYVWDTSAKGGRYRTLLADGRLGRFVANEFMADALREMATNGEEALFQLARAVRDGVLKPVEVQLASQIVLKDLYNAFTALAYGGWSNVPFAAWGRNGQILRYEYAYWRDFMREIMADGATWTDKALRARVALYVGKAFSRYWTEDRLQKLSDLDFAEERWYDVGDEVECSDCPALAAMGWVPLGTIKTVPGAGATECLGNCRCRMSYR